MTVVVPDRSGVRGRSGCCWVCGSDRRVVEFDAAGRARCVDRRRCRQDVAASEVAFERFAAPPMRELPAHPTRREEYARRRAVLLGVNVEQLPAHPIGEEGH